MMVSAARFSAMLGGAALLLPGCALAGPFDEAREEPAMGVGSGPTVSGMGPGATGSACDGAVTSAPHRDVPAGTEVTVPAGCAACPGPFSGLPALQSGATPPSATTLDLDGQSAGSRECTAYIEGSACGVVRVPLPLDPDGTGVFASRVPVFCGENVIRIVCANAAGERVLARRLDGTQCAEGGRDLRVTLSWDEHARDMELHLVRDGGRLNDAASDCTWFSCLNGLEWGGPGVEDNPRKDIDHLETFGPENVYLDDAAPGTYHVLVEYWGSGAPTTAQVAIAIGEQTVRTVTAENMPLHQVWYVGTVSYPERRFSDVGRFTDCEGAWRAQDSYGCAMPLP